VSRPGHGRPVGTTTAAYRFSWPSHVEPPEFGDVTCETAYEGGDPAELERAFLVVGIEETASRARPYRIILERLAWDPDRVPDWTWFKSPR
jgi:hypothetical protein